MLRVKGEWVGKFSWLLFPETSSHMFMQMFWFVSFNMPKYPKHIVFWRTFCARFCKHSPFQPPKGHKYDWHLQLLTIVLPLCTFHSKQQSWWAFCGRHKQCQLHKEACWAGSGAGNMTRDRRLCLLNFPWSVSQLCWANRQQAWKRALQALCYLPQETTFCLI